MRGECSRFARTVAVHVEGGEVRGTIIGGRGNTINTGSGGSGDDYRLSQSSAKFVTKRLQLVTNPAIVLVGSLPRW
jgi:hypothetical protein